MLSRQKRIPPLKSLYASQPGKKLKGKELKKHKDDFSRMSSPENIKRINDHISASINKK